MQATGEWFFGQDPKVSESLLCIFELFIGLIDFERFILFGIFRWSARAIKSLAMGELEARKLKYPTTGTEAILMGILVEGLCYFPPETLLFTESKHMYKARLRLLFCLVVVCLFMWE